jgi:hypothetical protein
MMYLEREKDLFQKVQAAFWRYYQQAIEVMLRVAKERGERLDTETPPHHRMSPEGEVYEVRKKGRRLQEIISLPGWEKDPSKLAKVVEECVDVANYALFLAAFAQMLRSEVTGEGRRK